MSSGPWRCAGLILGSCAILALDGCAQAEDLQFEGSDASSTTTQTAGTTGDYVSTTSSGTGGPVTTSAGSGSGGFGGAGGSGGSGGASGLLDAGSSDVSVGVDGAASGCGLAGVAGPAVSGQGFTLQYQVENTIPSDNTIQFRIRLVNDGAEAATLGDLEIRYYLTNELSGPFTLDVFFAGINGASVSSQATLVAMAPVPGADSYLRYAFAAAAPSLPAGQQLELNVGFHRTDYQQQFNECNDFSYSPSSTDFAPFPRIAVFKGGSVVWGATPSASSASSEAGVSEAGMSDGAIEAMTMSDDDAALVNTDDAATDASDDRSATIDAGIAESAADANPE